MNFLKQKQKIMLSRIQSNFRTIQLKWDTLRAKSQPQWLLAFCVYVLASQPLAWAYSDMGNFPNTLQVSHIVGWLSYTAIYAMVPFILGFAFLLASTAVVVLVFIRGLKVVNTLFGIVFKALGMPAFKAALDATTGAPRVHYQIKALYQYFEERNNWDDYVIVNLEGIPLNSRSGFWWINSDDDWFDDSNPRFAKLVSQYDAWQDVIDMTRAEILAKRELMTTNPEEYAKIIAKEAEDREANLAWRIELIRQSKLTNEELLEEEKVRLLREEEKLAEENNWRELYPLHYMTEEEKLEYYIEKNGEIIRQYYQEWKVNYYDKGLPLFPQKTTQVPNTLSLPVERKGRLQTLIEAKRFGLGRFTDQKPGMFETSTFDFVIPCSAEFRSIIELYSFVVYILLFIFLAIIAGIIFAITSSRSRTVTKWVTIKNKKDGTMFRVPFLVKKSYWNSRRWANISRKYPVISPTINKLDGVVVEYRKTELAQFRAGTGGEIYWVYLSRLEAIWTALPVLFLAFISLPSFTLALSLDESHKPQNWLKVNASQWFWVYEYGNFSEVEEDISIGQLYSNVVQGEDLVDNSLRLLEVDGIISVPANCFTRLLVTSNDVIHSFAIPSMGLKVDACPGRINAVTFIPNRAGVYYGQCSEICGVNHAFMPICIEVVA